VKAEDDDATSEEI